MRIGDLDAFTWLYALGFLTVGVVALVYLVALVGARALTSHSNIAQPDAGREQ